MKDILILGIETSCDETSAAVVKGGRQLLSNVISSQAELHKKYGGVVPEIASRKHVELIIPVIDRAVKDAGITLNDIGAIGVTHGPGLVGALLTGLSAAKGLAFVLNRPLIGVHHIEGHIAANYLEHTSLEPPFICLVASGGHSHIVYVKDYNEFEIIGRTRDDAAGEAFDKIARAVGLGYPGGPLIDKVSRNGNAFAINFPRVHFNDGSLDFSFSGLKTSALNYLNNLEQKEEQLPLEDFSASFQQAIVDILVENTLTAAAKKKVRKVVLAGGVAANSSLRRQIKHKGDRDGFEVYYPSPILCTDNGAMIACAAYYGLMNKKYSSLSLNAIPGLKIGER